MCHTIMPYNGRFLLDVRDEGEFLVGRKQFALVGSELYPVFYHVSTPFEAYRNHTDTGWVITHQAVGSVQSCEAYLHVIESAAQDHNHLSSIWVDVSGGIHISTFVGIGAMNPPYDYLYTMCGGKRGTEQVMLPVWFRTADVVFYDGQDVSVSELLIFDKPNDDRESATSRLDAGWWTTVEQVSKRLSRKL